jgi:tetratricopeptide (TPR) repeat protein
LALALGAGCSAEQVTVEPSLAEAATAQTSADKEAAQLASLWTKKLVASKPGGKAGMTQVMLDYLASVDVNSADRIADYAGSDAFRSNDVNLRVAQYYNSVGEFDLAANHLVSAVGAIPTSQLAYFTSLNNHEVSFREGVTSVQVQGSALRADLVSFENSLEHDEWSDSLSYKLFLLDYKLGDFDAALVRMETMALSDDMAAVVRDQGAHRVGSVVHLVRNIYQVQGRDDDAVSLENRIVKFDRDFGTNFKAADVAGEDLAAYKTTATPTECDIL